MLMDVKLSKYKNWLGSVHYKVKVSFGELIKDIVNIFDSHETSLANCVG